MHTFRVQGMSCGHCERAVIQAIQSRDAHAQVRVDREAGVVEVSSELSDEQIREAITEEGYQVH